MSKINRNLVITAETLGVLGLLIFGLSALTPLTDEYMIRSTASLQTPPNVEVYWDITTLELITEIAWGELEPSETKSITVYTKNVGNIDFTCYVTTVEWTPINAEDYITLDWDFGNSPLKVGRIRTTVITLRISEDITVITNFSFNIIVTAVEA